MTERDRPRTHDRMKMFQNVPQKHFEVAFNISLRNRFVFVTASKCASSTIKFYLQKKEMENSPFDVTDVDDRQSSPFLCPYQLGDQRFLNILDSSDFIRAAFVRNPYARVLACYLFKINRRDTAPLRDFRRKSKMRGKIEFEAFVRFICSQSTWDMNPHWRPLSDSIFYNNINYDFIGRVEALQEDLVRLGKLLYGEAGYQLPEIFDARGRPLISTDIDPLSPVNDPLDARTDPRVLTKSFDSAYSAELEALVFERYRDDFENFGYTRLKSSSA